jgi:hypothetical protein
MGDCHWISSILLQTNSNYREGMSVPQRTLFTNIPATSGNVHTLLFSHQATKGGIHAYSHLTSFEQAIAATTAAGVQDNEQREPGRGDQGPVRGSDECGIEEEREEPAEAAAVTGNVRFESAP